MLLVLAAFELRHVPVFREFSRNLFFSFAPWYPGIAIAGIIMCASGMTFAVWARRTLGRNWGMPMSLQEEHELVTNGPYAWVRHPIYTGILLALFGSSLVEGTFCFLIFLIFAIYFVYSAKTEEKLMTEQFPSVYPAYVARTKMLIPLVW